MISSLMDWLIPLKFKILVRVSLSPWLGFTKVDSWEIASAKCAGYESPNVVEPVAKKAGLLREQIPSTPYIDSRCQQVATAMLHCLAEIGFEKHRVLRVLDFGGAGGDYYYHLRKIAPSIKIEWIVIETPALVLAMQFQEKGVDESINWVDSVEGPTTYFDVVLLSSVLQYIEKPEKILEELAKRTNFIIINRLPLITKRKSIVAVQRIYTSGKRGSYPVHFFNEEDMIATLSEYGTIGLRWFVPEDQPVVGWHAYPNQGLVLQISGRS